MSDGWKEILDKFILRALSGDLKTFDFPNYRDGLKVDVSFGQGTPSYVPYIAFLRESMRVSKGVYPVYLFYKKLGILVLAYGVSETEKPEHDYWRDTVSGLQTIMDYFVNKAVGKPPRYGDSYVFKVYEVKVSNGTVSYLDFDSKRLVSGKELEDDLNKILSFYKSIRFVGNEIGGALLDMPSIEEVLFERVSGLLNIKKQIVFYGPPGTGKTYFAKKFCVWFIDGVVGDGWEKRFEELVGNGQVCVVQFHPSYSYEEFVEGIRPVLVGDKLVYKVRDGVFKRFCRLAAAQPNKKFVLIIDEINRGPVEKVFGELIYALEYRGQRIELQYSGSEVGSNRDAENYGGELVTDERFLIVPPNLYIIATMNTADRSIALLDVALRRRFSFVGFQPDMDLVVRLLGLGARFDEQALTKAANGALGEREKYAALSVLALKKLNERLVDDDKIGRDKQIGHTYLLPLMSDRYNGKPTFVSVWKYDVLPLLEEYFYYDYGRLEELFSEKIVSRKEGIRDFGSDELEGALRSFVGL